MKDDLDLILAISKKLGWDDMDVAVAIPAIQTIISHYIGIISDCTGDILTAEDAVSCLIENWSADDIFSLLNMSDYTQFTDTEGNKKFISLRPKIEAMMFDGFNFVNAVLTE